jgi:adenylate cyclase
VRKLSIALGLSVTGMFALSLPWVKRVEAATQDLRFRFRGPRSSKSRIVLVKITDRTMGPDHWWEPQAFWSPRLARVLTALDRFHPAWVGIDISYQAKTIEYLRRLKLADPYIAKVKLGQADEDDPYLVALTDRIGKVMLPLTWMQSGPEDIPSQIAALGRLSGNTGSVALNPDSDGVLRRFDYWDGAAPTFAPAIAARLNGLDPFDHATPARLNAKTGVSLSGRNLIDFVGKPFRSVDAADLETLANPTELTRSLEGAVVLIGPEHYGDNDRHRTPVDPLMSGVQVYANIVATLLDQAGIGEWPVWLERLTAFGFCFTLSNLTLFGSVVRGLGVGVLSLAAWSMGAEIAFRNFSSMWPAGSILLISVAVLGLSALTRAEQEVRDRNRIQGIFGKFVSSEVESYLMRNPDNLKLGGVEVDATVVFLDIWDSVPRGATRTPNALLEELNALFAEILPCVVENRGIVNRFTGDGCLALFGAPAPSQTHPDDAVRCCLQIQRAVRRFNERCPAEPFIVSSGIHTGKFLCGNMGSKDRAEFTAIGDVVNVAKRIETANRDLKTRVLASRDTFERLQKKPCAVAHRIFAKGKGDLEVFALTDPSEKHEEDL